MIQVEGLERRVAVDFGQRHMRVRIDETGRDPLVRQIDDLGAGRDRDARADGLYLAALHQDDLVLGAAAVRRVNDRPGANRHHLRVQRRREQQQKSMQVEFSWARTCSSRAS